MIINIHIELMNIVYAVNTTPLTCITISNVIIPFKLNKYMKIYMHNIILNYDRWIGALEKSVSTLFATYTYWHTEKNHQHQ